MTKTQFYLLDIILKLLTLSFLYFEMLCTFKGIVWHFVYSRGVQTFFIEGRGVESHRPVVSTFKHSTGGV